MVHAIFFLIRSSSEIIQYINNTNKQRQAEMVIQILVKKALFWPALLYFLSPNSLTLQAFRIISNRIPLRKCF